jgi:hypothetical protein
VSKVVAGKDWVVATITWVRDVGAEAKESTTLFVSELKAAGALFKRMTIEGQRGTREEHRRMEQSFREVCLLCIPLPFTPMLLPSCCQLLPSGFQEKKATPFLVMSTAFIRPRLEWQRTVTTRLPRFTVAGVVATVTNSE